jgi:N6-adenosine-specific RNA methylase IME4
MALGIHRDVDHYLVYSCMLWGWVMLDQLQKLPLFHYSKIYADPAWSYENWSEAGAHKNASSHYDCMSVEDIKALPVGQHANKDCVLFLWVTDPMLLQGLEVMKAWGFQYKTVAFTWVKMNKRFTLNFPMGNNDNILDRLASLFFMSLGYWTRANPEMCLMGTMGSPERASKGVRQLIISPLREHSRKPDRIRDDIDALIEGPCLELFSRTTREGWDSVGDETDKFPSLPKTKYLKVYDN